MTTWKISGGLSVALLVVSAVAPAPARAQTDEELRCQAVARALLAADRVRITGRTALPAGVALVTWRWASGDSGSCAGDSTGRIDTVLVEERAGSPFGGVAPSPGEADWAAYSVTCASDRERRTECKIRGGSRVRIEEQLSRSACTEGETWGSFGEVLWVDRGCRGLFEVSPLPTWPAYTLTCSSDSGRREECSMKEGGSARLTIRLSKSACVEGQTWGQGRDVVWVDGGCRARFEVSPAGSAGGTAVAGRPPAAAIQAQEACRRQVDSLGLAVQQIVSTTPASGGYRVELRLARPGGVIDASCTWDARSGQAQLSVR